MFRGTKYTNIALAVITVALSCPAQAQLAFLPGDFNRDGQVDGADLSAMMQALANSQANEMANGLTAAQLTAIGDVNGDGKFNNADLQGLINLLIGQAPSQPAFYLGDLNHDGQANAADLTAMMQALANPQAYATAHGITVAQLTAIGDINGDGKFNNADLQALINDLKASPPPGPLAPYHIGDVNGDGVVNQADLTLAINNIGRTGYVPGDTNGDGIVTQQDINLIYLNWGQTGLSQQQIIAAMPPPPDVAYANAPSWLTQIGVSQALAASANYGAGIIIGDVGTGIDPTLPQFANRISPLSNCLVGASCGNGYMDDTGHDTNVAEIAAGGGLANGEGVYSASGLGVAPRAIIVAMKVDSNGILSVNAIDAGIRQAADAGAAVINLSLGGVLGYTDAINYAASKGVIIVLAAGNDGLPYLGSPSAGIYGFTQQALSHIIVVGAVDGSNNIQSISNIPSANLIGTTETVTEVTTTNANGSDSITFIATPTGPYVSLQSIWLVTPASYTSFSAPQVAGAVALLDSRWPVVQRNGTAPAILFASATDLGDPGVDAIYGNGLLNVAAAFQPIGGLNAMTATGQAVPVGQVTASVVSGGALGSMSKLSSSLSNYTAFDSFQRDFQVNLSGLVTARPTTSSVVTSLSAPKPTVSATHFADGGNLAFGTVDNTGNSVDHPNGIGTQNWFLSFTDTSGSSLAAGYGFPASASFANALWGDETIAGQASTLNVANALTNLAQGGQFMAFGNQLDSNTRMAFSWSQTPVSDPMTNNNWDAPNARAFSSGITTQMTSGWRAGLTLGVLNEQSGLLGSTYSPTGPLNFGTSHQSTSVGISSAFNLSDKTDLLLEATMARTDGSTISNSLISNVSPLYARSFGASLAEHDTFDEGDHIELSVSSPLRVFSGTAFLATTSVDANGYATTSNQKIGMSPNGNEIDLAVSYRAPVRDNLQWNVSLEGRHDADNVAGATDLVGLIGASLSF